MLTVHKTSHEETQRGTLTCYESLCEVLLLPREFLQGRQSRRMEEMKNSFEHFEKEAERRRKEIV